MWGRPQRDPKRDSHEQGTQRQGADAERTHRRRHKDKGRKKHSPDQGYRSDDETRRRYKREGDRHQHREHSSHRPRDDNHQRQDSLSGTQERSTNRRYRSRLQEYGEHRYDSPPPPSPLPPPLFEEDRPQKTFTTHDMSIRTGWDDTRKEVLSPTVDSQRVHRLSLPPNAQNPAYTSRNSSPQDDLRNRSPTLGHHEVFNAETNPPRIFVSPYPADYSQALPDIDFPDDPSPAPEVDRQRCLSSPGTSTVS